MPDPIAVNSMFARIARRYDVANHLLSGGIDVWWRRRLVAAVAAAKPKHVLDLATGSGDVAFALARNLPRDTAITGMDFCRPMLDEAEVKKARTGGFPNVNFQWGDGLALPVADGSVDAVTISFGLRNMADRHQALCEMQRVLRPGGRVFVLEFSQPKGWFKPVYYTYLRWILPTIAAVVTRDRSAYDYLCGSISEFPDHCAMDGEITAAGFAVVRVERLTAGVVALHEAQKPANAPVANSPGGDVIV